MLNIRLFKKKTEPVCYEDLVYKLKITFGKPNFSDQFKKLIKRNIKVGQNMDIMRQSACLVVNRITVYTSMRVKRCLFLF